MTKKKFYDSQAWWYFSRWILLKYSDGTFVRCFTCNRQMLLTDKGCQCGHWIKTSDSFATALESSNVGPMCYFCNRECHGLPEVMEQKLISIHGEEEINRLKALKRKPLHLDKWLMIQYREKFKTLYKVELERLGVNPWKKQPA